MIGFDPMYFLFVGPGMIVALIATIKVRMTFSKYSSTAVSSGLTGAQAAKFMLERQGVYDVAIEAVDGFLSDHYDPTSRTLRLSPGVYQSQSLSAIGVACHEAGHALQHASGYAPLGLRNAIYPVASIGSTLAFPLFFIGFLMSSHGPSILMDIGIFLFAGAVVFSVLTLPVEFNASKRAVALLGERGFLRADELEGARKVLSAAALTYVASTAMAAMQLLRMFFLRQSRD